MARKRKGVTAPANTPAVIASMRPNEAVAGFKKQATNWHRASMSMVASGAVCLIVGAYSPNGNRVEYDAMILRLKQEVAETGIKQAQIYKYIGLSRGLVSNILSRGGVEGEVTQAVLKAKTHDEGMEAILAFLAKEKVKSLDGLGVLVGRYKRSEGPPEEEHETPEGGEATAATATRATPEAIGERIKSDPEVLNAVSAVDLVQSYMSAGHKPSELIEALIPHIDSARECGKLITKLNHKLELLRSGLKVVEGGRRKTG